MNGFISFEKTVIENILLYSEREYIDKIRQQYKNADVVTRKFTGIGFFTHFSVADKSLYLNEDINFKLGGIYAEINDIKYGTGFVLYVSNGVITQLEGYTYREAWPEEITEYKLYIVNKDGTLTAIQHSQG